MIPRPFRLIGLLLLASCGGGESAPDAAPPVETLSPEPAGAPTATVQGEFTDLACLGNNAPDPAQGGAVELTGYVRTFADPTAMETPPAAQVEAFSPSGQSLGSTSADASKDGRVALSVPVTEKGFDGYVVASQAGYLDYRFQSNLPVTAALADGYAWLVTQAEIDGLTSGITLEPGKAIVVGGVHDCKVLFGIENVVVVVNGSTDNVYYLDGPDPASCPTNQSCASPFAVADGATYTNETGRFAVVNLDPGTVTIKTFGRLTAGGALTLLSSIQTEVAANQINAVGLGPRISNE